MNKIIVLCGFLLMLSVCALIFKMQNQAKLHIPENPQRIISLAPAITETLYALGLGDKVVGVTQFCNYPPEVAQKARVAGFREVNLEAIAGANPDLVLLPYDMSHFKNDIEAMGIPVVEFNYKSLDNFLADVEKIGAICDAEAAAQTLVQNFKTAMTQNQAEQKPTVLFVVLNPDEYRQPVREMTIIGADDFYNGVIEAAGGQNIYRGNIPFPRISLEAVLAMNPDFIVLGAPELADTTQLEKLWLNVGNLKGASKERLIILNEPSDTIPGPRTLKTIQKLARFTGAAK